MPLWIYHRQILTTLEITELVQRYADVEPVVFFINDLMSAIDNVGVFHRLTAIIFVIEAAYHSWFFVVHWFAKRDQGKMRPTLGDLCDAIQIVKYSLGKAMQRPRYGSFSFNEKLEYYPGLGLHHHDHNRSCAMVSFNHVPILTWRGSCHISFYP